MSTNHTANYSLCQWEAKDKVLRTEFNEDNVKIDAAIKAVDRRADSLQSALNGKAAASALNSLNTTVNGLTASLAKTGNCLFYTTTYKGTGKFGTGNPNKLSFPHRPMLVLVCFSARILPLVQGFVQTSYGGSGYYPSYVAWSGNSVEWYHDSAAEPQMNLTGYTYQVLAFLDAEN